MTEPRRISFPYAEDTEGPEPTPPTSAPRVTPERVYPDVPMFYPGRRTYCTGCCLYSDWLQRRVRQGDPDGEWAEKLAKFKPRDPIRGEANCGSCKDRERTKRETGGAG